MDLLAGFKIWCEQKPWSKQTVRSYYFSLHVLDFTTPASLLSTISHKMKTDADKTYNLRISALRSLAKYLIESSQRPDLVSAIRTLEKKKSAIVAHHNPYTPAEVHAILDIARGWKHQALYIAFHAGLRQSEIHALNIDDIDLAAKTIHVRHGKGNKSRVVVISETAPLERWLKIRQLSNISGIHWLFTNRGTRPILSAGSVFKNLSHQVGFKISWHRCRATYATRLYELTKDIKLVQAQLGHSHSRTTDIYIQASLSEIQSKITTLGRLY